MVVSGVQFVPTRRRMTVSPVRVGPHLLDPLRRGIVEVDRVVAGAQWGPHHHMTETEVQELGMNIESAPGCGFELPQLKSELVTQECFKP